MSEPAYYSDKRDPVIRTGREQLFLVTLEARPGPDSDEAADTGGAFVNCWIDADDLRTAERRAVAMIRENGWLPHRFEEWSLVTRDTYLEQTGDEEEVDFTELVEQAFADGSSCIFHTWPIDEDEE